MKPADLYGLPLERFTEERNALAKELRKNDRRDEAERVAKLRKPSVAAWAVNQLVRTGPKDFDRLMAAGDGIQKTQADLLKGRGDSASLRRVLDVEREALKSLVERGRGLLTSDGHQLSTSTLEQVSETLHAAALDQDARAQVKDGCLDREFRLAGLGAVAGPGAAPGPAGKVRKPKPNPKPKPDQQPDRSAERRAARQAEAQARRRMERAARGVQVAEERRDRAAAQLHEAEEKLDAARRQAEEALAAHQQAERTLEGL